MSNRLSDVWLGCGAALLFSILGAAPAFADAPAGAQVTEDGYVQLVVTVEMTGNAGKVQFNSCPSKAFWSVDPKDILKGDRTYSVGILIDSPGVSSVALNPVALSFKPGFWPFVAAKCSVQVDQITYTSPPIYVRTFSPQQFHVTSTYGYSTQTPASLLAAVDATIAAAGVLTKIPPPLVSAYEGPVKGAIASAGVSNTQALGQGLAIAKGAVPPDRTWTTEGFIPNGTDTPASVTLTARVVPLQSIVDAPTATDGTGKLTWTPQIVTNSGFRADSQMGGSNPSGTVGGYFAAKYAKDIANYNGQTTLVGAAAACNGLSTDVQNLTLSANDSALLLWAIAHDSKPAFASDYDVDKMGCLSGAWTTYLPALKVEMANIPPPPPPPPTPPPAPAAPPTVVAMQTTTQIADRFADFFTRTSEERDAAGQALFSYPAKYSDPSGLLLAGSNTVNNAYQWSEFTFDNRSAILKQVGCYAYFDANRSPNLATSLGNRSLMVAIGTTAAQAQSQNREVALLAFFAPQKAGDPAKIVELDVVASLTSDQIAALKSVFSTACPSGYAPRMLFGQ